MITFVGAGPGDPDLITIKGRKALEKADIIIYAGSLVSPEHLTYAKETCEIYNSAKMHLDEVLDVMVEGDRAGKEIVRLHTGDPSIYGAIQEQMDPLEKLGIEFEVIPGVSSFVAAAAAIKKNLPYPMYLKPLSLQGLRGGQMFQNLKILNLWRPTVPVWPCF
ncbi:tetrapyrrole methylase [Peptoniphilus sp. oral taxon 375 str. F0436]|nr:tetrapyrrole methylase [Peptoniphilus sp. oral taxon 375 str. F0436]